MNTFTMKTANLMKDRMMNVLTLPWSMKRMTALYRFAGLSLLLFSMNGLWAQTQLGSDIDGDSDYDLYGYFVSLSDDGKTLGAGSAGTQYARVYNYVSNSWSQVGGDFTAWNISVSGDGNTVAAGSMSGMKGTVSVYQYISGSWTQVGSDIIGEDNMDGFGNTISLSDNGQIVAIGAQENSGGGTMRGHVRVYKLISGTWTQLGSDIDGEADYDAFGGSVAMSDDGSVVAIGAANNSGGGGNLRGHIRVYKYSGGSWTQMGSDLDGSSDNDQFGRGVSLSGDGLTIAGGAPGNNAGHVKILHWNGSSWNQVGSAINGEANGDLSGAGISLSDDAQTIAIGAFYNGLERGQTRIYRWISGAWTQWGTDIDGEEEGDFSGTTVAISGDGLTVGIGAYYNDGNGGYDRGHVRVYSLSDGCGAGEPTSANVYTGNKTIATQADLDAFFNSGNGKKYTKISGSLIVDGSSSTNPVTALCNLSALTEVTGSLEIRNFNKSGNPVDLSELSALTLVGCGVRIYDNPQLKDISMNLTDVGCSFVVKNNAYADSIKFDQLKTVKGDRLEVSGNSRVCKIYFSRSATGFTFTGKGSGLYISNNGNNAACQLSMDFNKVTQVKGPLYFHNNDNSGVSNFDHIFGGLTAVSTAWGKLTITNNDHLAKCCIAASATVSGGRSIFGNTGNCASLSAVTADCGTLNKRSSGGMQNGLNGEISVFPNPNTGRFVIGGFDEAGMVVDIRICDLLGKTVYSLSEMKPAGQTSVEILTDKLASGTYMVKLEYRGETVHRYLVISR